jgi:hypothetical protein
MFGAASVQHDEPLFSLLCEDANQLDDVFEREYTCKSVITDGTRRCAFNKRTAQCESIQDLVEDEVVKSIRSGRTTGLIPATKFAEEQFVRENPEANARLNYMLGELTNEMKRNRTKSKALVSVHPLAQLGLMLMLYVKRGMVFTKIENDSVMQQLIALMGVNAVRMMFDALAGTQDGSVITQIGTTLFKLFLPGDMVTSLFTGANMATVLGLWRYFKSEAADAKQAKQ